MPFLAGLDILTILVSTLIALIVLIVLVIYSAHESRRPKRILPRRMEISSSSIGEVGGWGGLTSARQTPLDEEEATTASGLGSSEPVDVVKSRVLLNLVKQQAVPLDILEQKVKADKEYIIHAIRELEQQGLVRIEGDMILISERGEKVITKLREKYAEKEDWFEAI